MVFKKIVAYGVGLLIAYQLGGCYTEFRIKEELAAKNKLEETILDEYRKSSN